VATKDQRPQSVTREEEWRTGPVGSTPTRWQCPTIAGAHAAGTQ